MWVGREGQVGERGECTVSEVQDPGEGQVTHPTEPREARRGVQMNNE